LTTNSYKTQLSEQIKPLKLLYYHFCYAFTYFTFVKGFCVNPIPSKIKNIVINKFN